MLAETVFNPLWAEGRSMTMEEAIQLALTDAGRPAVYFDGPGGTQVPRRVVDAMACYLSSTNANHGGAFATSRRSDADGGREYFQRMMTMCSGMMQQIINVPQPVIAAVQGVATAAGCQLVASCDLAVASTAATFATPGVDIGLFCSTPMVALSRNIARKHAMEMLLTGEAVSAEDAYRMGLINRVVNPGEEREKALEFARQIAGKSSHIVKIGKEGFYRQAEMNLAEAYRYVSEVMVENLMTRDAKEGLNAFIDKREPKWEDR